MHRRKQQRKDTPKEKKILKQFKKAMNKTKTTTAALTKHKERLIDKLRYKRVKLVKMFERGKKIMNNNIFQRNQQNFFKRTEDSTGNEGAMPEMEQFVKFWGRIWEGHDRTPNMSWMEKMWEKLKEKVASVNMPWMEKIWEKLKEKVTSVKVFDITENVLIS